MKGIKIKGYFDENYQLLANAIIGCAAKDYIASKKKAIRKNVMFIDARLNECERFFMSDYFIQLCSEDIDGSWFLKKLDEKVKEELKNAKPKMDGDSIERMRKEGMTYKQIGKMYGVTGEAVYQFVKREKQKKKSEVSKTVLEDMYLNKKMTTQEIAGVLGYSTTKVWLILKKYEIPTRNGGYERKEKPSKEEILQMIEAGFYGVQIAKKWNLSKTVFYKLCKDYKIRLPKGKKQSVTK